MCPKTSAIPRLALPLLLALAPLAHADVLAHWSFDQLAGPDHDTFLDSSGHKNAAGAPMNALVGDKGQVSINVASDVPFGKAVTFTGKTGAYLDVPYLNGIHQHSFSIAVWVYLTKNDRNYVLADWSPPMSMAYAFGFDSKNSVSHISALMKSDVVKTNSKKKERYNVDVIKYPASVGTVSLNTWHHVAWVWDREDKTHGTLTTYLDGAKVDAVSQYKGSTTNLLDNHRGIKIGFKQDNETTFHGSMDELWVFNDALTPDQVANLMKTNDIDGPAQFAATTPPAAPPAPTSPAAPTASPPAPTPAAQTTTPTAPETVPTPAPAIAQAPPAPTAPISPPEESTRPDFIQAATAAAAAAPIQPIPQLAVVHRRYSPERLLGILATGTLALSLSGFLVWASLERGRMRNGRA